MANPNATGVILSKQIKERGEERGKKKINGCRRKEEKKKNLMPLEMKSAVESPEQTVAQNS